MTAERCYLEKRRPEAHQARFYTLHLMPTLFGEWTLVREWGRIGSPGRVAVDWFDTLEEARRALARKQRQKLKKGYRALGRPA